MRTLLPALLLSACTQSIYLETVPDKPAEPETPVAETDTPVAETDTPVTDTPEDVWDEPVPQADKPVYANTRDALWEVDPASGAATLIGTFSEGGTVIDGVVDIAIDARGRLYAGDRGPGVGGPYTIYRVDPFTAEATTVCSTDKELLAMTFTADGDLIVGSGNGLYYVDLPSCVATPMIEGAAWETSGDVVGLPDGFVYWTVRGTDGDLLVVVDPRTGQGTQRGEIGYESLYGVAYDTTEGRLYGFSSRGDTVAISIGTGRGTLLRFDESRSWWGATTNPVAWGP